jgi:hypothetical protein
MERIIMNKKCLLSFVVIMSVFCFAWVVAGEAAGQIPSTPKGCEVNEYLKCGQTVFLFLYSASSPDINRIKNDIGSIVMNFRGAAAAVYASGDDKAEDQLRDNFNMPSNETAVFIVRSGQAVIRLEGIGITKANMMKALYGGCGSGGGGCGSGCK